MIAAIVAGSVLIERLSPDLVSADEASDNSRLRVIMTLIALGIMIIPKFGNHLFALRAT